MKLILAVAIFVVAANTGISAGTNYPVAT